MVLINPPVRLSHPVAATRMRIASTTIIPRRRRLRKLAATYRLKSSIVLILILRQKSLYLKRSLSGTAKSPEMGGGAGSVGVFIQQDGANGKGDVDTFLAEGLQQSSSQAEAEAVVHVRLAPSADVEIKRAVAETTEKNDGSG